MTTAALLVLALLLDAALGEPKALWARLPHPAVLMGRAVAWLDQTLNTGGAKRVKGICATLLLVMGAALLGTILSLFGPIVEIIIAAILLAQKSLVQHVSAVATGLRLSVFQGRRDVAMIVGRDTGEMDQNDIARAAIESGAENLSDGVIAPAFWFLIAGLPGILIYKVVNTADSMIGYRTPRHADFGWAAARLDDVLNWLPARLTALLIALPTGQMQQACNIRADAGKHRSPNAGWPEAAMARAINVALAGPRTYDGLRTDFPWVHSAGKRDISAPEIDAAVAKMWLAWSVMLIGVAALALGKALVL